MRRKSTSHLNAKLYFSTCDHAINSETACRALTEHHRGSHTIENSCCVAMHHHSQKDRYETFDMHDSKDSMHDVASPSPAFDTDDGDDGSSPCHFFLVSHHSLHDNPLFYSPRSQSYLSKTKHTITSMKTERW